MIACRVQVVPAIATLLVPSKPSALWSIEAGTLLALGACVASIHLSFAPRARSIAMGGTDAELEPVAALRQLGAAPVAVTASEIEANAPRAVKALSRAQVLGEVAVRVLSVPASDPNIGSCLFFCAGSFLLSSSMHHTSRRLG